MRKMILCFVLVSYSLTSWGATKLQDMIANEAKQKDPVALTLMAVIGEYLSDDEQTRMEEGESLKVVGRDAEADEVLDVMVRMKAKVPVLIAPAGAGKTAIALRAVQRVINREYPADRAFEEVLGKSHWVSITPSRLMRIAKGNNPAGRMGAVEDFFDSLITYEQRHNIKIVVTVDEFHSFDSDQVEALLPYLDSNYKKVAMFGLTNADKFNLAFKDNLALIRRVKQIPVVEFSDEKTLAILKESWIPRIEEHYGVQFSDRALARILKLGMILNPDGGKLDAGLKMAMDLAVAAIRQRPDVVEAMKHGELGKVAEKSETAKPSEDVFDLIKKWDRPKKTKAKKDAVIEEADLFAFFKSKTGYPVNPFNPDELAAYVKSLKTNLTERIVGQDRMIQDLLDVYKDVIIGTKKEMGVIAFVGPTGTGKSELGKLLAKYGFSNERAILNIDGNEYQSDDLSINKLFGAAGGLVTSNTRQGILCDWFDDPSQGKYGGVILIDEAERAHPKFWERLMEFFEKGQFVGADGRRRYARRHVVILTSNRGDKVLFPDSIRKWTPEQIGKYVGNMPEKDLKRVFQTKLSGKDEFQIPTPVLNRIDRFSIASPLHDKYISQIAMNLVQQKVEEIERDFEVKVKVDSEIGVRLGHHYYDIMYGARPVERGITQFFNKFKEQLLAGEIKNLRGQTVTMNLRALNEAEGMGEVSFQGKKVFEVELPKVKVKDPLLDPDFQRTVQRLKKILPERVFDQEDAIRRVTDAVVSYLSLPVEERRTLGIFLVGPTGIGKTELAKALSEAIFETPDRAEIIPFGEISDESMLNRVIGSPPGYVGSDDVRSLEKALRNTPDGGVLVFDEASNMGRDAHTKDALFKRLYHPFEESSWTSSATGETYDLRKHIVILTGNDGEELFKGTNSDIIREQTWSKFKNPEKVRHILQEKGIPQPFLGRMADAILMKPLTRVTAATVSRKLTTKVINRFESLGVKVELAENFYEEFGQLFYTADKGARSLRDVAEHRLNTVIVEALSEIDQDPTNIKKHTVRASLRSTLPTRPYLTPEDKPAKVELVVEIFKDGDKKPVATTVKEYTELASLPKRLPEQQAMATAYHEAGHAVLNDPAITGEKLTWLTILGDSGSLGFALYDEDSQKPMYTTDRDKAVHRIARLMAGQTAMVMAGYTPDAGWSSDLDKARKLARKMILEWGLDPEFLGVTPTHRDGGRQSTDKEPNLLTEAQIEKLSAKIADLLHEGMERAQQELHQDWDLVERIVATLMKKGFMSEEDFKALRSDVKKAGPENRDARVKDPNACQRLLSKAKK